MVLDLDGQALVFGIEARSLRHGPALEHSVELEAKVVVQAARRVALNGEAQAAGLAAPAFPANAARVRRPGKSRFRRY
jgi:hypothetical protein